MQTIEGPLASSKSVQQRPETCHGKSTYEGNDSGGFKLVVKSSNIGYWYS
jgi:hypothetical protein